jgi:hypothetical protein
MNILSTQNILKHDVKRGDGLTKFTSPLASFGYKRCRQDIKGFGGLMEFEYKVEK